MFFAFDGLDGTGKTTQIQLFIQWLREAGHDVESCVDPGSTLLGEKVREILLGHHVPIGRTSEMLLFMAARAQLVEERIRPALAQGKVVVSDRYVLANLVYQGYAGGLDVGTIRRIGSTATFGVTPDLIFVLDLAPEAADARMQRELDRMETQGEDFQRRLRAGFLAEAAADPRHIAVIDAAQSIEAVHSQIRAAAASVLAVAE